MSIDAIRRMVEGPQKKADPEEFMAMSIDVNPRKAFSPESRFPVRLHRCIRRSKYKRTPYQSLASPQSLACHT